MVLSQEASLMVNALSLAFGVLLAWFHHRMGQALKRRLVKESVSKNAWMVTIVLGFARYWVLFLLGSVGIVYLGVQPFPMCLGLLVTFWLLRLREYSSAMSDE